MFGFDSQRGQSEILGGILVFALILIGIGAVLAVGGSVMGDSTQAVAESQVQESLVELASEGDAVTRGEGETKQVDLNLNIDGESSAVQVRENAGSVHLEVGGTTVHDGPLGAVVYETEDTTIAYQGGGVWRADGEGASMVSGPSVTQRGSSPGTLTFPIVQVAGSTSLSDQTVVSQAASSQLYPSKSVGTSETVTIRIESQFATAWADYFVTTVGLDESAVSVSNGGTVVEVTYASSQRAYLHATHYRLRISDA
jgi:hypothetical protein